ncbi:hypothetical protein OOJ91_12910 [Micromonospora lupini]|uniref:hypothetical protein n=1 Tax=Micromonospora lupini TaxID=285679 RepID=UPI002253BC36|nr:hypothetical protein [Micromonospora lupini]MCX5066747.1 hypothetical protein [Micromonospora lupini]
MTTPSVEVIARPNGKAYRPRKAGLRARPWEDDSGCGVVVFGTLDPDRARRFAGEMCAYWYDLPAVVNPQPGWYRDGFRYGERAWVRDEKRGAPGVMFAAEDGPLCRG